MSTPTELVGWVARAEEDFALRADSAPMRQQSLAPSSLAWSLQQRAEYDIL